MSPDITFLPSEGGEAIYSTKKTVLDPLDPVVSDPIPIDSSFFVGSCSRCLDNRNRRDAAEAIMAVPMAFHAAKKVRENMNKPVIMATENSAHQQSQAHTDGAAADSDWNNKFKFFESQGGILARRYNEKMMNAIWGLYNRNSAHNFKSRVDGAPAGAAAAATTPAAAPHAAASTQAAASVMSFDSVAYQISRFAAPVLLNHQP